MTEANLTKARAPVVAGDPTRALIKAIAMDIGKAVVHHIMTMYPDAAAALRESGRLSVRNCVHNEIMAALEVTDEGQIIARLQDRKEHRRIINKLRKARSVEEIRAALTSKEDEK